MIIRSGTMKIPATLVLVILGIALLVTGIWVGQHVNVLPLDASANAPVYDELFKVLFSIGTILLLGIVGLVVFSLVRFRRRPNDLSDGPPVEGNLPLEILWTAIPAIVVLFIGIYSYDIYDRMGGMTPLNDHGMHHASEERTWAGISPAAIDAETGTSALPIEVTAMQFAFIFHYPEAGITSGELHVPVGRPVALQLKANDVIHAFWVPQFRLKQDVIPGQPTLLSFIPTRAGQYPIVCAELCGPYHGGMRSTVVVEEPETFAAWVAQNSPVAPPTPAATVQS
jgi:cytochrome c oxidase subunit 2